MRTSPCNGVNGANSPTLPTNYCKFTTFVGVHVHGVCVKTRLQAGIKHHKKRTIMSTESKRQQRFAGVIQQDLGEIFQREAKTWAPGAFITVTRVRVTPDLAIARIYLSFLNTKTAKDDLVNVKSHVG